MWPGMLFLNSPCYKSYSQHIITECMICEFNPVPVTASEQQQSILGSQHIITECMICEFNSVPVTASEQQQSILGSLHVNGFCWRFMTNL